MPLSSEDQLKVNRLRLQVGERMPAAGSESDTIFTDDEILLVLEQSGGDYNIATLGLWIAKAAHYAGMYDRSESGSVNLLSQLYRQAAGEVKRWEQTVALIPGPHARVPVVGKAISWAREECDPEILWVPVRNRAYTPGNWVTS